MQIHLGPSIRAVYYWVLRFIQLQLFITIFSLPILIAWGLPFSALSFVGNLIFSPVLALFLFISCLIFFCEMLCIPNTWLIYVLEVMTRWWLTLLKIPDKRVLVGCAYSSKLVLALLPVLALSVLFYKKTGSLHRSIISFISILLCFMLYAQYIQPTRNYLTPACNAGVVHIIQTPHRLTVVDPGGAIGQRASSMSWVQFTLVPYIIKQTGKTTIDHLVLLEPGTFLLQAITQLTRCITVKNLYLINWQGSLKKSGRKAYFGLKRSVQEQGITWVRFGDGLLTIADNGDAPITIKPLEKSISRQDISYPACSVQTQIDNNDITFYSAKYKHKEIV